MVMLLADVDVPPHPRSLRADLDRRKLEQRARRLEFVLDALKDRARAYEHRGAVPRPLHEAIGGFTAELRRDRARLAQLRPHH